ncbi:rhamnulokinase [candidate division KSB1 bacterium]|nr:rhamnulokinase [candidate division KSB1 bacterium]
MRVHHILGFDIGASSGRTLLGTLQNEKISIKELHRFPNGMIDILGKLRWNILDLFENIKQGMKVCASEITTNPASIAVDTWGVDYGLFAADGNLLGLPYGYRDARTDGMMEELFKIIPRDRVYELTGIQFMQLNTLFQLFSMKHARSPILDIASDLLFMPDIISYFLTGIKKTEFTIATTSQLYNPREKDWDDELFQALGISKNIMQEIVPPGRVLGNLLESIANETGLERIPVVATASHDTGAAVAAVPAEGKNWAYISSGTWSLVGVETAEPIINKQSLEFNFTNEGGVGGTFRFLKNCMGLWPIQQCRKTWSSEKELSYAEMTKLAASARPFVGVIDPDYQGFLNPPDMPEAIREYCRTTKQTIPNNPAEMIRSILEGLALKYRYIFDQLKQVHPHPIHRIHIIGGGTQNKLLSQFTADATGIPVVAGPVEATAIGNILVQAMGMGMVKSHAEMRKIIANSFELENYEPMDTKKWDAAYDRFVNIIR